jgi:hypothetical protein
MDLKYFVAVRPRINNFHSVHKEGCPFLTEGDEKIYLGLFNSDQDAEDEGKRHFIKSKSCPFCSKGKKRTVEIPLPEGAIYGILHYSEPDELSQYQDLFCCIN